MKPLVPAWSTLAMAVAVPIWLLAVPAETSAQRRGGTAGARGGNTPAARSGGGRTSGGGQASGGRDTRSGGERRAPAPNSGASSSGSGGRAVQRGTSGTGRQAGTVRAEGNPDRARQDSPRAVPVPPYSRPRDGNRRIGDAVPRTQGRPLPGRGGAYARGGYSGGYYGGFYPLGFGGLGFGYSDHWSGYYDPWGGGYYGPWDGGDAGYYPPYGYGSGSNYNYEGSLRLRVEPRDASVLVDGYYVGTVDDFDGVFQRLYVEAGPHRIEIRAPGHEPLTFDVRLDPGRVATYTGELVRLP